MAATTFSRQIDAASRASTTYYWENLVLLKRSDDKTERGKQTYDEAISSSLLHLDRNASCDGDKNSCDYRVYCQAF